MEVCEMRKFQYEIGTDCVRCGLCIRLCPRQAIHKEETQSVIDQSLCIGCGKCQSCCPVECIQRTPFEA